MSNAYTKFGILLCGIVFIQVSEIQAQEAQSENEYNNVIAPIVVTATKRNVLSSEITGGVRVIESRELEDAGVEKLTDLDRLVPELRINRRGGDAYTGLSMRGIFSADFYNPSVVVLVDGVAQDQSFVDLPLTNVERVEILKGPQGTLYGRNAHAGVINIVTRSPGNETRGSVGTRISALDGQVESSFETPLVRDMLYSSLTVSGFTTKGETDDLAKTGDGNVDDSRGRHANAKLRYAPNGDPLDVTLGFFYDRKVTEDAYFDEDNWRNKTNSAFTDRMERLRSGASLAANYDFGDMKLTSITGMQARDMNRVVMGFKSDEDQDSFSEEIRLSYKPKNSDFSGVVGGYAESTSYKRDAIAAKPYIADVDQESYAVFGEGSYSVTRSLALTAGGRYSMDKSEFDFNETGGLAITADDSWSRFTPKVGSTYKWSQNITQYATLSSGYKPGGFNRTIANTAAEIPYDPEYSWNYETGLRGDFLDRRLRLEASVYHVDTSDMQLYAGPVGSQVLSNAGDGYSNGFELNGRAFPTDDVELSMGLDLNRSRFESSEFSGENWTPYTPRISANVAIQYYWNMPGVPGDVVPRLDVNYYGKSYLDVDNRYSQDPYALCDFRLQYEKDDLRLSAFVENLFDKDYKTYQFSSNGIQAGNGRNIGVALNVKF